MDASARYAVSVLYRVRLLVVDWRPHFIFRTWLVYVTTKQREGEHHGEHGANHATVSATIPESLNASPSSIAKGNPKRSRTIGNTAESSSVSYRGPPPL